MERTTTFIASYTIQKAQSLSGELIVMSIQAFVRPVTNRGHEAHSILLCEGIELQAKAVSA